MEQFIKDAMAGGWKPRNWEYGAHDFFVDGIHVMGKRGDTHYFLCSTAEILLDPKSWVAVGKARGWSEHFGMFEFTGSSYVRHAPAYEKTLVNEELYTMHRFIDALAEGKSIEEALQALK